MFFLPAAHVRSPVDARRRSAVGGVHRRPSGSLRSLPRKPRRCFPSSSLRSTGSPAKARPKARRRRLMTVHAPAHRRDARRGRAAAWHSSRSCRVPGPGCDPLALSASRTGRGPALRLAHGEPERADPLPCGRACWRPARAARARRHWRGRYDDCLAWRLRRVEWPAGFGIFWFLLLLVPSSALAVLDQGEPMAEHRVYLASVRAVPRGWHRDRPARIMAGSRRRTGCGCWGVRRWWWC